MRVLIVNLMNDLTFKCAKKKTIENQRKPSISSENSQTVSIKQIEQKY